jgi:hypothetical protein
MQEREREGEREREREKERESERRERERESFPCNFLRPQIERQLMFWPQYPHHSEHNVKIRSPAVAVLNAFFYFKRLSPICSSSSRTKESKLSVLYEEENWCHLSVGEN